MERELLENMLTVTGAYEAATDRSRSYVARAALGNSKFFDQIESGIGWTARTYDRLMQWLSDNWPEGFGWPPGVERPQPQPQQRGDAA